MYKNDETTLYGAEVAVTVRSTGVYTITVIPLSTDDTWVVASPITAKLRVSLTLYSGVASIFIPVTITVNYAACSCAGLTWTAGTEPAVDTVNMGSSATKTLSTALITSATNTASSTDPGVRTCYRTSVSG